MGRKSRWTVNQYCLLAPMYANMTLMFNTWPQMHKRNNHKKHLNAIWYCILNACRFEVTLNRKHGKRKWSVVGEWWNTVRRKLLTLQWMFVCSLFLSSSLYLSFLFTSEAKWATKWAGNGLCCGKIIIFPIHCAGSKSANYIHTDEVTSHCNVERTNLYGMCR